MLVTLSENSQAPIVYIVDDDDGMRRALANLLDALDVDARCFASAEQFLAAERSSAPGCLILDVRLPGIGGLQFQDELRKAGVLLPVIFITAHGDIPMSVRAMKAGAVEFLPKPFRDQDLIDAVQLALARDRERLETERESAEVRANYMTLTAREREVLHLAASGLMNKQIAAELGLAEITVKIHRSNISRKMEARSIVDLVNMLQTLNLEGGDT